MESIKVSTVLECAKERVFASWTRCGVKSTEQDARWDAFISMKLSPQIQEFVSSQEATERDIAASCDLLFQEIMMLVNQLEEPLNSPILVSLRDVWDTWKIQHPLSSASGFFSEVIFASLNLNIPPSPLLPSSTSSINLLSQMLNEMSYLTLLEILQKEHHRLHFLATYRLYRLIIFKQFQVFVETVMGWGWDETYLDHLDVSFPVCIGQGILLLNSFGKVFYSLLLSITSQLTFLDTFPSKFLPYHSKIQDGVESISNHSLPIEVEWADRLESLQDISEAVFLEGFFPHSTPIPPCPSAHSLSATPFGRATMAFLSMDSFLLDDGPSCFPTPELSPSVKPRASSVVQPTFIPVEGIDLRDRQRLEAAMIASAQEVYEHRAAQSLSERHLSRVAGKIWEYLAADNAATRLRIATELDWIEHLTKWMHEIHSMIPLKGQGKVDNSSDHPPHYGGKEDFSGEKELSLLPSSHPSGLWRDLHHTDPLEGDKGENKEGHRLDHSLVLENPQTSNMSASLSPVQRIRACLEQFSRVEVDILYHNNYLCGLSHPHEMKEPPISESSSGKVSTETTPAILAGLSRRSILLSSPSLPPPLLPSSSTSLPSSSHWLWKLMSFTSFRSYLSSIQATRREMQGMVEEELTHSRYRAADLLRQLMGRYTQLCAMPSSFLHPGPSSLPPQICGWKDKKEPCPNSPYGVDFSLPIGGKSNLSEVGTGLDASSSPLLYHLTDSFFFPLGEETQEAGRDEKKETGYSLEMIRRPQTSYHPSAQRMLNYLASVLKRVLGEEEDNKNLSKGSIIAGNREMCVFCFSRSPLSSFSASQVAAIKAPKDETRTGKGYQTPPQRASLWSEYGPGEIFHLSALFGLISESISQRSTGVSLEHSLFPSRPVETSYGVVSPPDEVPLSGCRCLSGCLTTLASLCPLAMKSLPVRLNFPHSSPQDKGNSAEPGNASFSETFHDTHLPKSPEESKPFFDDREGISSANVISLSQNPPYHDEKKGSMSLEEVEVLPKRKFEEASANYSSYSLLWTQSECFLYSIREEIRKWQEIHRQAISDIQEVIRVGSTLSNELNFFFTQLLPLIEHGVRILHEERELTVGSRDRLLSKRINMAKQLLYEEKVRKMVSRELPRIRVKVLRLLWEYYQYRKIKVLSTTSDEAVPDMDVLVTQLSNIPQDQRVILNGSDIFEMITQQWTPSTGSSKFLSKNKRGREQTPVVTNNGSSGEAAFSTPRRINSEVTIQRSKPSIVNSITHRKHPSVASTQPHDLCHSPPLSSKTSGNGRSITSSAKRNTSSSSPTSFGEKRGLRSPSPAPRRPIIQPHSFAAQPVSSKNSNSKVKHSRFI